jgi:dethiobiotin synthetase
MKGLFFTGTDTGVGKTFVTAAVAILLRSRGRRVSVSKPVATGARRVAGRLVADDTDALARAAGVHDEDGRRRITPWMFVAPAAPPVAARLAETSLSLPGLLEAVLEQGKQGGITLVEGVGGLLCPLTEQDTVADLAARLGLPLVVVARRSLGTLNHTLLTVEAALGRGLRVAGVVVSETHPPRGVADETNPPELQRRLSVPLLAVVPHSSSLEKAAPALAGIDWEALASG